MDAVTNSIWTAKVSLEHPKETFRALKFEYDDVSSLALDEIQRIHREARPKNETVARLDFYEVLNDHHAGSQPLSRMWDEMHTVPSWVDWEQLERGQKVFYRYGLANLIGFALQGFMGENAATPGIAEVLVRTGGFSTHVVLRRALETFQWLLEVTRSIESIKPGGDGHISTARIRLLHAAVRQRILRLTDAKPDYFDVEKFGLPVNRLDDIHSIALFACNPMWLQLPLMGIQPTEKEIEDYVALFRYLGYLLAVPDHFFASVREARTTMEAMCLYERDPTKTSAILCHNFIAALADRPPYRISAGFIEAGARIINGDAMSDLEGLRRPSWASYAQFQGFCSLCRLLVWIQRHYPRFDKYVIELQREVFYRHMIEDGASPFSLGGASKFPMKYDPQVGKLTGKEEALALYSDKRFFIRPLETLFMAVFIFHWGFFLVLGLGFFHLTHRLLF